MRGDVLFTASRIAAYRERRLAAGSVRRRDKAGKPVRLSAASINRPLALLRHLLRLAHEEWEVLSTVPKIRLEKEPQGRLRWLEPDDEHRLIASCRASVLSHLADLVTVALETGMRRSEAEGLTWDRVDLSRGVLRLEITKSRRRREIPMRQRVYDVLASRPARARAASGRRGVPVSPSRPPWRPRGWTPRSGSMIAATILPAGS